MTPAQEIDRYPILWVGIVVACCLVVLWLKRKGRK